MSAATAVGSVFCGCQINVVTLEYLVQKFPRIGYTLTLAQFAFVALCALPLLVDWKRLSFRPRQLNLKLLLLMSLLFWASSALNNAVFMFNISMPIHTTFRSSSLIVNIILGYIFFKRRYSAPQLLCALVITIGIIVLTLEANQRSAGIHGESNVTTGAAIQPVQVVAEMDAAAADMDASTVGSEGILDTFVGHFSSKSPIAGISVLAFTVMLATVLGLVQDKMMTEAKKRCAAIMAGTDEAAKEIQRRCPAIWAESMFYGHALSVPLFFLWFDQVKSDWGIVQSSPDAATLVVLNCITQMMCICGVYQLADRTSSFTVTLVLTLRKFVSLTFSVFYFGHFEVLGVRDWTAMVLVAAGGLVYPFVPKYEAAVVVDAVGRDKKKQ